MTDQPRQPFARFRRPQVILLIAVAVIVAGAVYGIGPFKRNAGDAACSATMVKAHQISPLIHGEIAGLQAASEGLKLPDLTFTDASGAQKTLADWKGRTVLLNLWATWCVPCRKEMPALAALQQKLGGDGFEVVAINIDTRDPEKPKAWLKDVGVNGLNYYADPSAKVFQDLKVIGKALGMPTTIVVDPSGCEIASLAGPAEWASDDAVKFVSAAIKN
jgi:thiol-disulfide isomerase/thioredoxin